MLTLEYSRSWRSWRALKTLAQEQHGKPTDFVILFNYQKLDALAFAQIARTLHNPLTSDAVASWMINTIAGLC